MCAVALVRGQDVVCARKVGLKPPSGPARDSRSLLDPKEPITNMTSLSSRLRRLAALGACAGAVLSAGMLTAPSALADTTDSYACTGATQTSAVPAGDNLAIVTLNGAAGGSSDGNGGEIVAGGRGEQLVADVPVTAGSQFDVLVGCQGGRTGGFGGGANGGIDDENTYGAGGGGASYVLPSGGAFSSLYAIAGGGGGAGDSGGEGSPNSSNGAGGGGGNAESNGLNGGEDTADLQPGGEGGFSGNNGGAGGTSPSANPNGLGLSGSAGQGGRGGNYDSYEGGGGGGGGGGLVGGGGGGYGFGGGTYGGGGGGGGGGQGGVQHGASLVSANDAANAGDGSVSITYTVAADITVNPTSKDFGTVTDGQTASQTLHVTDTGQRSLVIGQLSENGGEFTLVPGQDDCSGQIVAGGQSCTFEVRFAPSSPGAQTGDVEVPSNAYSAPLEFVQLSGTGQTATTPTQPTPPTAPKLVEQLTSIGTPTAGTLYSHGEKVRVHCNQACSVNVTLMVYHRAIVRGNHYRGLLHADRASEPWARVGIAQTVVTLPGAGFRTVLIKLKPGSKTVLSYAGSILLGVYTTPAGGRGPVSKRWVTIPGPDMNAKVSAHQHSR